MTGHVIKLPKGTKIKNGKIEKPFRYRDASHAIQCKKSKKQKPQRRIV